MIKVLVAILTLYNAETNMYQTTATMVESTVEECERNAMIAGRAIVSNFGGYNTIMVRCIPIENL